MRQTVSTFYSVPPPAVTWQEIVGGVSPILVIMSSLLSFIPGLELVGVASLVASQLINEVSNVVTAQSNSPVLEEKFDV